MKSIFSNHHIKSEPAPAPTPKPVAEAMASGDARAAAPASDLPRELGSNLALNRITTPETSLPLSSPDKSPPAPATLGHTDPLPGHRSASARLTFDFRIVSLRLTPFFKLGAVQFAPLSNDVSLHLINVQSTGEPLAAGISFRIGRVELDAASRLQSLRLEPLGELRAATPLRSGLQIDHVALTNGDDGASIAVATSEHTAATVQLVGTFTIVAMEFTPAFEISSLRLEPASNTLSLCMESTLPAILTGLLPSFEIAEVQIDDDARMVRLRVNPSATGNL